MSKHVALAAALLFAVSTAAGLQASPNTSQVNATVGEPRNFTVQLSTGNLSAENITVENDTYLSWDRQDFDLGPGSSTNLTGTLLFEEAREVNRSLEIRYMENGTEQELESRLLVDADYPDTSIDLSVFQSEFELQFEERDSSVIEVRNTGNTTAYNVTLQGRDINFSRQGFDIPRGGDKLVEYSVQLPLPQDNRTEATNQTYNRRVNVSAQNSPTRNFSVSVLVPFKEYDPLKREERNLRLLRQVQQFCRDFPEATICGGEIVRNNTVIKNRTETEYRALLEEEDGEAFREIPEQVNQSIEQNRDYQRRQLELLNETIQQNREIIREETEEDVDAAQLVNQTQRGRVQAANRFYLILALGIVGLGLGGLITTILYTGYKFVSTKRDRRASVRV